ncbi:MAG: DNA repair protein RecO [Clostridia bacterium]|nr:DNA repair protein RecO [Clostridia bacterium]
MEQLITQGIVLRAIDCGERDKIITIYTPEKGRVTAILKGVRKLTAKMKFASQPFCFAQFRLVGRQEMMTVAGASEIESFFDITQSYAKMVCGSAILEMTDHISVLGEPNYILFDALKQTLRLLANSDIEPDLILMRYALGVFKISGYAMELKTCAVCGKPLNQDMTAFDLETGDFNCYKCPVPRYLHISARSLEIMQKLSKTEIEKLEDIVLMENEAREFRQLIRANFEIHFGVNLKSLNTAFN